MKMTLIVPENLDDIELSTYQKFLKMDFDKKSNEFVDRTIMRIFYEIGGNDFLNFSEKDVRHLVDSVFLALQAKPKFKSRFVHRDIEWGFIPNLNDITYGEFVDLQSVTENLIDMMAILYRPVLESDKSELYSIEPYEGYTKYSKYMEDVPISVVAGATGFFLNLWMDLVNSTLQSLAGKGIRLKKKSPLVKNGDGIQQLFRSQEMMLTELTKAPPLTFTKHLFLSVTNQTNTN